MKNFTTPEKMHNGEIYIPMEKELLNKQLKLLDQLKKFNKIKPSNLRKRQKMMKKLFAEVGENCYIESPFYANFGGKHIHFGDNVYCNFGCTFVDDTHIYVGDNTLFAPNVIIAAGTHPVEPSLREQGYQYNKSVHIGKNCWLGAGTIVLPGITIGDNTVIGAGSVVTKDIPANSVAVGNPCKVIKTIQ